MTPAEKKKVYMAAWREANKEKLKEERAARYAADPELSKKQARDWLLLNKERKRETGAEWRKKNIDRLKAKERKRREDNKEKMAKQAIAWRKANPQRVKEMSARTRIKNKDKVDKRNAEYRRKNREIINKRIAVWRKRNAEKCKVYRHNKRARKNINGGQLSKDIVSRLIKSQKGKCAICKVNLKKAGHHIDHIVPLIRGGRNDDRNVQLTCPACNMKKSKKDPIQFMQEMGYLL